MAEQAAFIAIAPPCLKPADVSSERLFRPFRQLEHQTF